MKLWQNAFQTICNFSFFDAEKNVGPKKFQKILEVNFCFQETGVLEELGRFERHWHVGRKKLLPVVHLFWGDFLGEGLNDSICVENLDLAAKMISKIWYLQVMTIV